MISNAQYNPLTLLSNSGSHGNFGKNKDYKFCTWITSRVFKCRKNIFDAIIDILIENESGLGNLELYEKAVRMVETTLSKRDHQSHLDNMTRDGLLLKRRRQRYEIYSLTEMAKNATRLGILGVDNDKIRLRRLYQYIVLCECFYHGKQIAEKKLDGLLHFVNATRKKLRILSRVRTNGTNCCETVFKPLSTIRVRMIELDGNDNNSKSSFYFYKEEGFTIKELVDLLNSGIRDYPLFVGDFWYDEIDIIDCIERLRSMGIIGQTRSYADEEPRYAIRDISLQKLKDLMWDLHSVESAYLDLEGSWRTLTEYEKEGLIILFGSIGTHRIIKEAYDRRKLSRKALRTESKKLGEDISIILDKKIRDFHEKFRQVIRENYLLADMIRILIIRRSVLKNILYSS
jgi:hypothetical protein